MRNCDRGLLFGCLSNVILVRVLSRFSCSTWIYEALSMGFREIYRPATPWKLQTQMILQCSTIIVHRGTAGQKPHTSSDFRFGSFSEARIKKQGCMLSDLPLLEASFLVAFDRGHTKQDPFNFIMNELSSLGV